MKKRLVTFLFFICLLAPIIVTARAGGGGSSSSGSSYSGSSSGGSGSSGSYASDSDDYDSSSATSGISLDEFINGSWTLKIVILVFILICATPFFAISFFIIRLFFFGKNIKTEVSKKIAAAAASDPTWREDVLVARVKEVFLAFQNDWSSFSSKPMKAYLAPDYYNKTVLEMGSLHNMGRQNVMSNINIQEVAITEINRQADNSQDSFTASITAYSSDQLYDLKTKELINEDRSQFTEFWHFIRQNGIWVLASISQSTEDPRFIENDIARFAKSNGFYYDPDFGLLIIPSRGAIFSEDSLGEADVNNHVIGVYHQKIVEFYTYRPWSGNMNYLVAQAILPIKYQDILLQKKSPDQIKPHSLRKIDTEWGDFNDEFSLYADPQDQVNSFELLTTNFMAKLYELPFEVNIEVIDNVLYIYTLGRKNVNYDELLKVLNWAFEQMKM